LLQTVEASDFKFYENPPPAPPAPEAVAPYPEAVARDDEPSRRFCFPDLNKWAFSSVSGVYYQNESTILTVKNGSKYIKIWVSRLKDEAECQFEKEYVVIDCVSNAKGEDWYNVSPVDPDDEFFVVLKDICASFSGTKTKAKKSSKK
jgi:hypothetical protein